MYLLGATLFEVLVGEPPHCGKTLVELAAQSLVLPEVPASVPRELQAIIERALEPRPAERFESADAFRRALSTYLSHRGSIELTHDAHQRVIQLEALLASGGDRVAVYQAFGAARFGFLEALRTWPDNPGAREGLERAVRVMIDFELADGDPLSAQALLAELTPADEALVKRVAEAVRLHRQEQEELRATSRDYDPSVGRRTRWFVSLIFGVVWTIVPIGLWAVGDRQPLASSHLGQIVANVVLCVFGAVLFLWARDSMTRTAINRGIVGVVTAAFIAQILVSVGCWIADVEPHLVLVIYFAVWTAVAGAAVATIEARLWPTMVVFGASFLAGCYQTDWRHLLAALGNAVLAINATVLWSRAEDVTEVIERRRAELEEHRRKRRERAEP